MKKKHLCILTRLVYITILTTFWVIAYERPEDVFSKETNDDSLEIDRLFQDMDILKTPHITSPIEISLMDLNGKKIRLSDFKGKIVFLNFWTTWCVPCRLEMISMEKLHTRLKDKDFVMVAIDLQEPAAPVKKYLKEYQFTFMTLLDSNGDMGLMFGIRSIPTTLILDKKGMIIGVAVGARAWASKKSITLFEHLINQEVEISS